MTSAMPNPHPRSPRRTTGAQVTRRSRNDLATLHAKKLQSMGQLAAGIAHEINSPLQFIHDNVTFIQQHVELLLGALRALEPGGEGPKVALPKPEELRFLVDELPNAIGDSLEGVRRVRDITTAMRDFSHPGSGGVERFDLNRAIRSTVAVCRSQWKNVASLELELDDELPEICGLPGALSQVVLNLVVNAAQAIRQSRRDFALGRIVVTTGVDDDDPDWIVITVADTGGGIPEEARPHVFDPFFTTKKLGEGTGQGLAIAGEIVCERHRGEISFETTLGEGTTFVVRVPIDEELIGPRDPATTQELM